MGTFQDCKSLTSVTIPNSVTSVGAQAFSGCSSLVKITIPSGVTTINSHTTSINGHTTSINTHTTKINSLETTISGKVSFSDLSTSGKTTINGGNITTGTIDASKVTVTNLSASNIKSGTISSSAINIPGFAAAYDDSTIGCKYYDKSDGLITSYTVFNPWGGGASSVKINTDYFLTKSGSDWWKGVSGTVPINVAGVVTKTLYFKNGIFVGYVE